jgi:hypothetical protein
MALLCHSSPIISIQWHSKYNYLLVVPSESNFTAVWDESEQSTPLLKEWNLGESNHIKDAIWTPTIDDHHVKYMIWDGRNFAVVNMSACSQLDDDLTKQREGSPQLLQDDDTQVRDLVNGVQQSEWGQGSDRIEVEDTFHGKLNLG